MPPKQNKRALKQPKESKKKRPKAPPKTADFFSVAAIGAPPRTMLRGITKAEATVTGGSKDALESVGYGAAVLEIVAGAIAPCAQRTAACMESYNRDQWSSKLGAKMHLTPPKAGLLRAAAPAPSDAKALLGCTRSGLIPGDPGSCTFIVRACAQKWTYKGLHEARDNATRLTGPQLLALFQEAQDDDPVHPGIYTLRPYLWTHALGAANVTDEIIRRVGSSKMSVYHRASDVADVKDAAESIHIVALGNLNFEMADAVGNGDDVRHIFDVATNPATDADDPRKVRIAVPPSAPEGPKLEDILHELAEDVHNGDPNWRGLVAYHKFVHLEGNDPCNWTTGPNGVRPGWPILPVFRTLDALLHPSMHQSDYKSLLQKLYRFKPTTVTDIRCAFDDEPVGCDPVILLELTVAVGVTKRGDCFNPDLAKYIRGQVAIMKRLAIIAVEDGGHLSMVPDLLALALAASEIDGYNLSARVVSRVISLLCEDGIMVDAGVIRWRSDEWYAELEATRTPHPTVPGARRNLEVTHDLGSVYFLGCPETKRAWKWAAHMVDFLGAFPGDKDMMYAAANKVSRIDTNRAPRYEVPVLTAEDTWRIERPMPWLHYLDQHVTRDVGYAAVTMEADDNDEKRTCAFKKRHDQVWRASSGYNPRTHPFEFDENNSALVEVRAAQKLVLVSRLTGPAQPKDMDLEMEVLEEDHPTKIFKYTINRGALAAGIGQIENITVETTVEENRADGMVDAQSMTRWNLVCCLGADSDTVVAMHKPAKHASDNLKKPRLTTTVERRADAAVRAIARRKGFKFKSAELPTYKRVHLHQSGERPGEEAWILYDESGDYHIEWSFATSDFKFEIRLALLPLPEDWPAEVEDVFRSPECATDAATYQGTRHGIIGPAKPAVKRLALRLTSLQRQRLVGFLRQKYVTVRLPAPGLQGGMGSDETDRALAGDWAVARALLLISRLVPAALQVDGSITRFRVVNPNVLRVVEGWLQSTVFEETEEEAHQKRVCRGTWTRRKELVENKLLEQGCALMDYQANVLETMEARDAEAVVPESGHFVALDVGMGKTLLGIVYLIRFLARTGCGTKVLWFTAPAVVESHLHELSVKWGLPNVQIVKTAAELEGGRRGQIAIVPYGSMSNGGGRDELVDALVAAAPKAVCCFDETHMLYNPGVVRNAGATRIALATPKFVMMTATPVGSRAQKLALTWLSLSASFEVNIDNMMVASARMLAARVKLPFEEIEAVEYAGVSPEIAAASLARAREGDWGAAARLARTAANARLCEAAIRLATADRAHHADGGVFLVAENQSHAHQLLAYTQDAVHRRNRGYLVRLQGSTEDLLPGVLSDKDPNVGIVVGVLRNNVGFNLERLGHMVIGVYPGNAAARYQIRGRIKRMTQKHARLTFTVVVPKGTVLELLHERQISNDAKANAIEQIGQEWLLTQPAAPVAA